MIAQNLVHPFVVISPPCGALAAMLAKEKKRPLVSWFMAGAVLGPLALIPLFLRPDANPAPKGACAILIGFVAAVLWLAWRMMYAD